MIVGGTLLGSFMPILITVFFSWPNRNKGGRTLIYEEAPLLWEVVEEVARQVGTRPVDTICIAHHTGIGVTEQGGLRQRARGRTQRQLLLGFGALPGLTQAQFKAILAHEYGHFSHRDTAGGSWALLLRTSIGETMMAIEEQASDTRSLPWIMLVYLIRFLIKTYYLRVFLPVTIGATRLQEILADRFAALAYGGNQFASGLTHIVRQSLIFEAQVQYEEQAARKAQRKLHNLYALPPLDQALELKLAVEIDKAMNRPTSFYDTHPVPKERIHLIEALNAPEGVAVSSDPVWDLLQDAEALQMELTGTIQAELYRRFGHSWAK